VVTHLGWERVSRGQSRIYPGGGGIPAYPKNWDLLHAGTQMRNGKNQFFLYGD